MTFPNPKWLPDVSDTLDAAAAVNKGGGEVGLPITGHGFQAGQVVTIAGTVNYNGAFIINSATANEIVITATYVAETFAGTETVDFGPQVILKGDLRDMEDQIVGQPGVRMQPPLVWESTTAAKVAATADCIAQMALTGLPNILNSAVQVSGGLCDGKARSASIDVSLDITSGGLYGARTTVQWYAVLALAGDDATTFTLKGMPYLRVKSQTGQAIKTGTMTTPGTGKNYAFTDDEFVGGKIYFLSGASKGLMRAISANDVDTDTRITYTGAALSVAEGDWFLILPPTNFRLVGYFYLNSTGSGEVGKFIHKGNVFYHLAEARMSSPSTGIVEDTICAPPTATALGLYTNSVSLGHPDCGGINVMPFPATNEFAEIPIQNCKYYKVSAGTEVYVLYFKHPPGCGY